MDKTFNPATQVATIRFDRTEFTKVMRLFANDSRNRKMDRDVWKRLKRSVVDSNVTSITGYYDWDDLNNNRIVVNSRVSINCTTWTVKTHPSMRAFIDYVFETCENDMGKPIDNAAKLADSLTMKADYFGSSSLSNIAESAKTAADTLGRYIGDTYTVQPAVFNWGNTVAITSDVDILRTDINRIEDKLNKLTEKKENKSMFNFDFGKVTSDSVRVSMYGVAVKSVDGKYVSYDPKTHSVMDVEIMNMPCGDFLYKMPVAIKDVKAGDVVIHNRVPMFVVETHESTMKVIDIREGTEKEIYLTKSPFGFNFATKIVSLMDMTGNKADESNPFGVMLPFMLMGENKDFDPMMLMFLSQNGGSATLTQNPMMMYFLMKDTNHKDMLPLMLMMNAKG